MEHPFLLKRVTDRQTIDIGYLQIFSWKMNSEPVTFQGKGTTENWWQ